MYPHGWRGQDLKWLKNLLPAINTDIPSGKYICLVQKHTSLCGYGICREDLVVNISLWFSCRSSQGFFFGKCNEIILVMFFGLSKSIQKKFYSSCRKLGNTQFYPLELLSIIMNILNLFQLRCKNNNNGDIINQIVSMPCRHAVLY